MAIQQIIFTDGSFLDYECYRYDKKVLSIHITKSGLEVRSPITMPQSAIEEFLQKKQSWIQKHLNCLTQEPIFQYETGEYLWLLGEKLTLEVAPSSIRAPKQNENKLILAQAEQSIMRQRLHNWYEKHAYNDFSRRIQILATKMQVPEPGVALSRAKKRWGSCNSRQRIRLNWRLIQAPPKLINHVVVHELAHLKEMNHSPKFWAVVAQVLPDYKELEKELRVWSGRLYRLE